MAKIVESFTAKDGYVFQLVRFPSKEKVSRGKIVFVHGIRSHAGWYERSCEALAAKGYDVVFLDRRGAGANQENRGDCPSFRRLIDDIGEFLQAEKQTLGAGQKLNLTGISWGGKLAIALPIRHPGLIDRVLLATPGIVAKVDLPFKIKQQVFFARLFNPKRMFTVPLNEPQLFTSNQEKQAYIQNDPLGIRDVTARFMLNSVQLDWYIRRNLKHVSCPVLLMSAGKDQIVDHIKTREILQNHLPRGILQEKLFTNAEHTLEFDCWEEYVAAIDKYCS